MINQINPNLPKDKELAKQVLENQSEIERIKIERGWLGKIWGNTASIPNNVAALSIVLLLLTAIGYSLLNCKDTGNIVLSIKDFWAIILPFMTLCVGYLFGDYVSKKKL